MFTEIIFKTILKKYTKKIKTFITLTCLPENSHKLLDTNFKIKTFIKNLVIFDQAFIGRGARQQAKPWCRGVV